MKNYCNIRDHFKYRYFFNFGNLRDYKKICGQNHQKGEFQSERKKFKNGQNGAYGLNEQKMAVLRPDSNSNTYPL